MNCILQFKKKTLSTEPCNFNLLHHFVGRNYTLGIPFLFRPVTDFNEVVLHFIECIFVHMEVKKIRVLVKHI